LAESPLAHLLSMSLYYPHKSFVQVANRGR
jgi:hypothetical protein